MKNKTLHINKFTIKTINELSSFTCNKPALLKIQFCKYTDGFYQPTEINKK